MADRVTSMLADVDDRLRAAAKVMPAAWRQLADALPGYPSSASGASGGGGGRVIVVEDEHGDPDRVPVTSVEAIALGPTSSAASDLERLRRCLRYAVIRGFELRGREYAGKWSADPVVLVEMALIATEGIDPSRITPRHVEGLRNAAEDAWGIAAFWGRASTERDRERAAGSAPEGCKVHARHGLGFVPVHKDGACGWCYSYRATWGHYPPKTLIDRHDRGSRISQADVLRHDPIARQAECPSRLQAARASNSVLRRIVMSADATPAGPPSRSSPDDAAT